MHSDDPSVDRFFDQAREIPEESEEPEDAETGGLYPGDHGLLPADTRRVMVQLLAGPFVDGRRHSKLWPVLMRDEAVIRSRLSELFLELVVDADQQVAFIRQVEIDDLDTPILLRRAPLTLIDSVVLLFLRQCLTRADVRGERAVVDAMEIVENASPYQRAASTDHAGFNKKVQASIQKMKKYSILQKIRGAGERYEISPTLKLLFSADQIAALCRQYEALAGEGEKVFASAEDAENPQNAKDEENDA